MSKKEKILVYGYGNPGRQDDALGSEFINLTNTWIENNNILNIQTDCNYQLNIEDAERISNFDKVFFVDAVENSIKDFELRSISPSQDVSFSTHSVHPAYILYMCDKIFDKRPTAFLIQIKGYEWNFMAGMTMRAKKNLYNAFAKFKDYK